MVGRIFSQPICGVRPKFTSYLESYIFLTVYLTVGCKTFSSLPAEKWMRKGSRVGALTSFVAPEIGPGTMAASLTMSMASLAVSGTVRAPAARTGSAARAPVKAVGGSAFMPAKLASKMTMKSSLAGALEFASRSAAARRFSQRELPSSSYRTESPYRASSRTSGSRRSPSRRGFRRRRFRLFSCPLLSASRSQTPHSPLSTPRRPRHAFRRGDSQARSGPWCSGRDCGWQVHRLHPPRHPPRARSHLRLPRPSPDPFRPQGAEAPSQEGPQVPRPRGRRERLEQGEEEVPQVREKRRLGRHAGLG